MKFCTSASAPRALLGRALLGLAALAALLAGALLSLADAHAVPPPEDVQLIIGIDDADGVVEPGQEINVRAAVQFTGGYSFPDRMVVNNLRIQSSAGWDDVTGASNTIVSGWGYAMGHEFLQAVNPATGNIYGERANLYVKALDGRTAVAVPHDNRATRAAPQNLFIFDTWTKRQALMIEKPTGSTDTFGVSERLHPARGTNLFADGNAHWDRADHGTALAVWQETETLAWIFAGDPKAAVDGQSWVGRVWIYSLDWRTDPPTETLHGYIAPPLSETGNQWFDRDADGQGRQSNSGAANSSAYYWASFGSAVEISADGGTLAVGAPRVNRTGAVYVFTRPDGEGESWADLAYEDGVKVTPYPIPHWGTSEATGTVPYSSAADCDQDCRGAASGIGGLLGWRKIALSEDGRVMAVGAPWKQHSETLMGGQFTPGTRRERAGEAYVFVAPEGGWQAAPDVVTGKTVIEAKTAAPADYSKETHVSPGPNRRITDATATLQTQVWPYNGLWHIGQFVAVTLDGSTVAVGTNGPTNPANNIASQGPRRLFVFQVNSADDWDGLTAEPYTTAANIGPFGGFGAPGWCGFGFTADAATLVVGQCAIGSPNVAGEVRIMRRPSSGTWVTGSASGTIIKESGGARNSGAFGYIVFSPDRERLAIIAHGENAMGGGCCDTSANDPGRTYLNDSGCVTRFINGIRTNTCPFTVPSATITIPPGEADGSFVLSGQATVALDANDGAAIGPANSDTGSARTARATALELRIGATQPAAEARLEFALEDRGTSDTSDDVAYPSSLTAGQRTVLRLQVLTAEEQPAGGDGIASILATTSRGSLSSNIRDASDNSNVDGCLGAAGGACQIDPALLTGARDDWQLLLPPDESAFNANNILLTLTHSGRGGPADVRVRVVSKDGTSISSEVVRVDLTGPPTALSIAEPNAGVLGIDTPDADDEDEPDNRDILKLSVTAADSNGLKVAVPTNRSMTAWVTGPDGRRVTSGLEIAWPLGGSANPTRDSSRNLQVQVDVDRAANTPLANGEYTLTVRAGSLSAEQTFMVSGVPAAVALSDPPEAPALQSQVSVTATITDAAGDPVPDGTRVTWESLTYSLFGDSTALVQLSADARTTAGQAESTWLVVGPGQASIRATAGTATEIALVEIPDPSTAPPEPESLAKSLSSTMPNAPTSWLGSTSVQASDLLAALEGVTTIQLWQYNRWVRYGVVDSRVVPGSFDFIAQPGDVLWLSE